MKKRLPCVIALLLAALLLTGCGSVMQTARDFVSAFG